MSKSNVICISLIITIIACILMFFIPYKTIMMYDLDFSSIGGVNEKSLKCDAVGYHSKNIDSINVAATQYLIREAHAFINDNSHNYNQKHLIYNLNNVFIMSRTVIDDIKMVCLESDRNSDNVKYIFSQEINKYPYIRFQTIKMNEIKHMDISNLLNNDTILMYL